MLLESLPAAPEAVTRFVDHLHSSHDEFRAAISDTLHDHLAGFLVAAAMDVERLRTVAGTNDALLRESLEQIHSHLKSALTLKRAVTERLWPSLLGNVGLFRAVSWHARSACQLMNISYEESPALEEIQIAQKCRSNIFRAVETLIDCSCREANVVSLALSTHIQADTLTIAVDHRHAGFETSHIQSAFPCELWSSAHRIVVCGGDLTCDQRADGLCYLIKVPLSEILIR